MPQSSQSLLSQQQKFMIIGGGPSGLYTAIKLVKKGVNPSQIILCDPRIGRYTRPGHLGIFAFEKASEGVGVEFNIDFKKGETSTYGHIKDIERALYSEALKLGITIIQDRFCKLTPTDDGVDIVFENEKADSIHLSDSDYLFDCTGTRRMVVNSVNQLFPQQQPFKLETITNADKTYKHHFLAYVKMTGDDLNRLTVSYKHLENMGIRSLENFKEKILSLRQLGWTENSMPRFYWVPFGKEKLCFYLHAPESLPVEQYDAWFQALLNLYADDLKYTQLPPSKKYGEKPRFNYFQTSADCLSSPCFKQENFPQVIALGDAMIDPDYFLSHGIGNGLLIINELSNYMNMGEGQELLFNESGFMAAINARVEHHKFCMGLEGKVANNKRAYFIKVATEKAPEVIMTDESSSPAASSSGY